MQNQGWKEEITHLNKVLLNMKHRIETETKKIQTSELESDRKDVLMQSVLSLEHQMEAPYFGRIDVEFKQEEGIEKMYIGPATYFDEDDRVLIYDWRAPIASLFYEGTLGDLTYQTPAGNQEAHAYLKRDIVIRKQQIESIYDVDNQESRLMETLSASSNRQGHLESITATIQQEQNAIIRFVPKDWVVVNGCAGSGKTTILLQRVAYLMYHANQKQMNDMLLLSRNQLFAKYISHVIPSLTGSDLYQKTIWEKTVELFKTFHLHQYIRIHQQLETDYHKEYVYLPDVEWIQLIQKKWQQLTIHQLHFKPLRIKGVALFSQRDFKKLAEQLNPMLSIHQQLSQIQAALQRSVKRRLNKFFVTERAQECYESISPMRIELWTREHDKEFSSETEYYQFLGSKLFEKEVQALHEQIEHFTFVDVAKHLMDWLPLAKQRRHQLDTHMHPYPAPIKALNERQYQVTPEGVRLLNYLMTTMTPVKEYNGYSHLFIDEIQDVSLLLLSTLSAFYFRTKFTVVGDAFQSFHLGTTIFSLEEEPHLRELLFPNRQVDFLELTTSYRCTEQITRFANGILSCPLDKNVFPRRGDDVMVVRVPKELGFSSVEKILQETNERMHTTGIICRTKKEAIALKVQLTDWDIPFLENGSEYLGNAFIVTTIEVAKGLEFDQVILWDVSKENYHLEEEQYMLYTSCTRAKHLLYVCIPEYDESEFIVQNPAKYQLLT